jgi:hypothetical protein
MAEVKDFKVIQEIPLNAGLNETLLINILRELESIRKDINDLKRTVDRGVIR